MVSLNKVMLIGRVGTDPECRYTPSGVPVVSFRLAVSRFHTSSDGQRQQDTDWFTVVAWNKLADGKTNYRTEIVASVVTFLDRQESNEGGKASDIMEDDGTLDISFDDGGIVELD